MRERIRARIETITSQNGYAVFPRRVVLIEEAGAIHQQPERTAAIIQDTQGRCGVLLNVSPGATDSALRQAITTVLSDAFDVTDPGDGLPILVSDPQTGTE